MWDRHVAPGPEQQDSSAAPCSLMDAGRGVAMSCFRGMRRSSGSRPRPSNSPLPWSRWSAKPISACSHAELDLHRGPGHAMP